LESLGYTNGEDFTDSNENRRNMRRQIMADITTDTIRKAEADHHLHIGKTQEGVKPYKRTTEQKAMEALADAEQQSGHKLDTDWDYEEIVDDEPSPRRVRTYYGDPNMTPANPADYQQE